VVRGRASPLRSERFSEALEAQLRNLERAVQYSKIRVQVEAPPKEVRPIVTFPSFDPHPALASALALLYSAVYALIAAAVVLAPFATLGAGAHLGYRRVR